MGIAHLHLHGSYSEDSCFLNSFYLHALIEYVVSDRIPEMRCDYNEGMEVFFLHALILYGSKG